jgi:hypothetical protein
VVGVPDPAKKKRIRNDPEWKANGFFYPLAAALMWLAQKASLVEHFKNLACRVARKSGAARRPTANVAIDVFVVFKFTYVVAAWGLDWDAPVPVAFIVYLLVTNSTTYFFYNLWILENASEATQRVDTHHRDRRRFVNLVLAMAFSMLVYAYLYKVAFPAHFDWPPNVPRATAAISFSIGNALTSTAGGLHTTDELSYLLAASQLVFTFGFVAMLLSNTIPKVKAEK